MLHSCTLGIDFLPKIMRGFLAANPTKKIDFNLYCDKVLTADILNGLKEKKYDLGFCSMIDNEPLIEFIPVARQELVVIVPSDHPLAAKRRFVWRILFLINRSYLRKEVV